MMWNVLATLKPDESLSPRMNMRLLKSSGFRVANLKFSQHLLTFAAYVDKSSSTVFDIWKHCQWAQKSDSGLSNSV